MPNDLIDRMRARVLEMSSPHNTYTLSDFNREFANAGSVDADNAYKLQVSFSNKSKNPDPEYATNGSSGFDLRADLDFPVTLYTGKSVIIPTGLYFELPENTEIQVRPRSGLAAKHAITIVNTPGTIDADYRGEIKVILINHGTINFTINNGDRIAQAVIAACIGKNVVSFKKVTDVSTNTDRGANGLGSTGHN